MTNLATLIGIRNFQILLNDDKNTYVVLSVKGEFKCIVNERDINYSDVVGVGNYKDCMSLAKYLNTQSKCNSCGSSKVKRVEECENCGTTA